MTASDLGWLREQAIRVYLEIDDGHRLDGGGTRTLDDGERRAIAFFEASVRLLARKGLLAPGENEKDHVGLHRVEFDSVFE